MTQLAIRATRIFAAMTAVVILAFAMVMTVSAQSDDPDWKVAPTGLNVAAGDNAGELDLTWDAHPQTSKNSPGLPSHLGNQTVRPSAQIQKPTGTPTQPQMRSR